MLQLKGKILYTATSDIHLAAFHYPYIKWLDEQGYEVHLAMEKRADLEFSHARQIHYMPFPRTPLDRRNVSTYRQLKNLIDKEQYDLIHCHTPMPGVLTRLAARARRKKGAAVLYTAHGFHFFKGAPLKYWLSYFPAEYALSFITDAIITINSEDFTYADKRLHPRKAFMIPGIGIDSGKFRVYSEEEKKAVRLKYGFKQQQFLLLYIAEFIPRKNHRFILENLPALIRQVPTVQVIFAGRGELMDQMLNLARNLRVEDHVRFMGFMHDLGPLAAIADVGISASRQEGLGLGLAEQMLCGVPVVATEDRGHKELVIHEQTGLMFPQGDQIAFREALVRFSKEPSLRQKMGNAARLHAEKFRIEASLDSMRNIYNGYLKPDQKNGLMLKGTKNKWIYLAYYFRQLDQDKMRRFVRFASEKTGRSRWSLWADAIRSVFRYNTGLIDYFLFRFYEKTPEERAAWAGTGFMYEYHLAMNPLDARDILANKIRFYEKYDQFVVHAHCTIDDLHANNEQAVKVLRHPTDKLVLKDALGQCGWGIEVISKKEFSAEQLVSHMEQKGYDLAEVFIDQHEVLQELSPSGLNTLRVITQLNDHGGVDYLGARLRITINSQVDNMASGNMAAPVDLNTGVVSGPAVFSDITKEPVHVHPISGLTIPGLQLPHWPAVLRMTKEAALLHPENRSVGWDIALTPAGPELIEGNHNWCKLLWQLPVQTGLKDVLLTYLK